VLPKSIAFACFLLTYASSTTYNIWEATTNEFSINERGNYNGDLVHHVNMNDNEMTMATTSNGLSGIRNHTFKKMAPFLVLLV
jgi:hypothetical protein